MDYNRPSLKNTIDMVKKDIGEKSPIVIKNFYIGKDTPVELALIYVNGLADKEIIDRDILKPLMLNIDEGISIQKGLAEYLAKRYITMSNTKVTLDFNETISEIKRGKTAVYIDRLKEFIILDTQDGKYRDISDPLMESSTKSSRESFVENLEFSTAMIRRNIRDKNLVMENFTLGTRTQRDLVLIYISDVADPDIINKVRERISVINADRVDAAGYLEQFIEDDTYSVFPQMIVTERVDRVCNGILSGKVILLLEGSSQAITLPVTFVEFFHTVEDYYNRTVVASFTRILRFASAIMVITLLPAYLIFIKFNSELIPLNFIIPIISSRREIALNPFLEILLMELVIEFLREGGLRLPSKIAQTLSVVGGIIVGDTALRSRFVSPTTLFLVGIAVVFSFVIPNYEMSLTVRFLRFPMLIFAQLLGALGIGIGWFLIMVHLCSLDSFGVPYIDVNKYRDMKDKFTRAPIWKFNHRRESLPHLDDVKESNFREKWRRKKDEKGGQ